MIQPEHAGSKADKLDDWFRFSRQVQGALDCHVAGGEDCRANTKRASTIGRVRLIEIQMRYSR